MWLKVRAFVVVVCVDHTSRVVALHTPYIGVFWWGHSEHIIISGSVLVCLMSIRGILGKSVMIPLTWP